MAQNVRIESAHVLRQQAPPFLHLISLLPSPCFPSSRIDHFQRNRELRERWEAFVAGMDQNRILSTKWEGEKWEGIRFGLTLSEIVNKSSVRIKHSS